MVLNRATLETQRTEAKQNTNFDCGCFGNRESKQTRAFGAASWVVCFGVAKQTARGRVDMFYFAKQTPRPAACFEKQMKHTAASGLFGCGDGTYPSKENRWKAKAKQQTAVASGVLLIALIARYSVPLFST